MESQKKAPYTVVSISVYVRFLIRLRTRVVRNDDNHLSTLSNWLKSVMQSNLLTGIAAEDRRKRIKKNSLIHENT